MFLFLSWHRWLCQSLSNINRSPCHSNIWKFWLVTGLPIHHIIISNPIFMCILWSKYFSAANPTESTDATTTYHTQNNWKHNIGKSHATSSSATHSFRYHYTKILLIRFLENSHKKVKLYDVLIMNHDSWFLCIILVLG